MDTPNTQIHDPSLSCIDTPNTQIHDPSLSCLGTGTSVISGWCYNSFILTGFFLIEELSMDMFHYISLSVDMLGMANPTRYNRIVIWKH
jgi:hypothetical protein